MGAAKAVVVGGGTGAPVSIRTLLSMGFDVCAVVAMADDGGSTGILRERAGAIPPGDIRKCLVAMAADDDLPLVKAFKYRFDYASNHALGNLVLTALNQTGSTFPRAIEICEQMLGCKGHVYPSTLDQVTLLGHTRDGRDMEGQSAISASDCALERVCLREGDGAAAYGKAVDALEQADIIVLGPGSLFTSIIPNILVPGILSAIRSSKAACVFVCSCADMQGETWGLSAAEHVEALLDHGMRGRLDYCVLNKPSGTGEQGSAITRAFARIDDGAHVSPDRPRGADGIAMIPLTREVVDSVKESGVRVITGRFTDALRPTWHDPVLLAKAFWEVHARCRLRQT